MTPTYTAKILKLAGSALDVELKAALDEVVYLWPSLALRALADAPGSMLAKLDLSTNAGIAELARSSIAQVEILATRKGLAQYRVHARGGMEKVLFAGLKKGMSWPTSAASSDHPRYVAAARAGDKLIAAVVDPGSAVPAGAVEVLAFGKKGPGATKAWLNHPGAIGVACRDGRAVSWGGGLVKVWALSGELQSEAQRDALAADLWRGRLVTLTAAGLSVEGEEDRPGVRAFAVDGERLWTIDAAGLAQARDGERVERQFQASIPGDSPFRAAARGEDLLVSGADAIARWYRGGEEVKTIAELGAEGGAFLGMAMLGREPIFQGQDGAGFARDGRALSPRASLYYCVSAGDRLLGVRTGAVTHATVWDARGEHVQQRVLPEARLHSSQRPVRLSPGGSWIICPEAESRLGGVLLTGTRGQGQARFPNPKADYDFVTEAVALDEERVLVGYGNHDALVWHVDGRPPISLGRRVYHAHAAGGRLVTGYDRELTAWSADLSPIDSWTAGGAYLHWLEVSANGRYVLYGMQYSGWVRDLETKESWEIEQEGGVDHPTFAGHESRFFFNPDSRTSKDWHAWDARARERLLTLPGVGYVFQAGWGEGDTAWICRGAGIYQHDLKDGAVLFERRSPPLERPRQPLAAAAFTGDQRLVTLSTAGSVTAWKTPAYGMYNSGYMPPAAFEPEPGIVAVLGAWPGRAFHIPKTR